MRWAATYKPRAADGLSACKISVPLKLITPPGFQNYDCQGCGACCRGRFAIIVTQADRERIVKQGWTDEQLALEGKPLFTPLGDEFQLAHRSDGACVFLQDDNRCRIHADHGETAKPVACRMYPFRLIPLGNQVRVDVRFDCPSTAGNVGRPITAHRGELLGLLKATMPGDVEVQAPPAFFGHVKLTWEQLYRVTEAFERLLLDVSLDITRRVNACINMAALLRNHKVASLEPADFGEFLDDLVSDIQGVAVNDGLKRNAVGGIEGMAFRHMLGVYGRIDEVGAKTSAMQRIAASCDMIAGNGNVPILRSGFPISTFAGISAMRDLPAGPAALAIERYLHVHLASMSFCGRAYYNRSYLDGLNGLLLTFPLICWFARAYAEEASEPALTADTVAKALMIVDHQHGVSPLLNVASHRYLTGILTERKTLRTLAIAYGS